MTKITSISRPIVEEIVAHAREDAPLECCGILAGTNDIITNVYRTDNDYKSVSSYFVNPTQLFKALKDIESNGLEMMGIYHSHPSSSPTPSGIDKKLAFIEVGDKSEPWYPDCLYFIISLVGEDGYSLRAFYPHNGDFEPAEFVIIEKS